MLGWQSHHTTLPPLTPVMRNTVSTEQLLLGQQQEHHLIILLARSQVTIKYQLLSSVVAPGRSELRTSSVRDSHSTDYNSDSLSLSLSAPVSAASSSLHVTFLTRSQLFVGFCLFTDTLTDTHSHLCNIWQRFPNKDCSLVWTKWMINWVSVPAVFVPIWRYLTFSLNFIMDCLSLDIEESWSHESPLR